MTGLLFCIKVIGTSMVSPYQSGRVYFCFISSLFFILMVTVWVQCTYMYTYTLYLYFAHVQNVFGIV